NSTPNADACAESSGLFTSGASGCSEPVSTAVSRTIDSGVIATVCLLALGEPGFRPRRCGPPASGRYASHAAIAAIVTLTPKPANEAARHRGCFFWNTRAATAGTVCGADDETSARARGASMVPSTLVAVISATDVGPTKTTPSVESTRSAGLGAPAGTARTSRAPTSS